MREFRLGTGLSQVVFARRVGLDSTKLAAIEHCRSPLKFVAADRICDEFDICQRWLAVGRLPKDFYIPVHERVRVVLPKGELFSVIYDRFLARLLDERIADLAAEAEVDEERLTSEQYTHGAHGPVGQHPLQALRDALCRVATLSAKREGRQSTAFILQLRRLFDSFSGGDSRSPHRQASELAGDLLAVVLESVETMKPADAANFIRALIEFAETKGREKLTSTVQSAEGPIDIFARIEDGHLMYRADRRGPLHKKPKIAVGKSE